MKEKQEIGIWVIQVTRCECCRRAGGVAVGWGQCGSHLVLPNPSMAELLMAQPLVGCVHFWRRGYGHSSESPLGQMCVEPPLDLDFPHTQWKSITTQKKQRAGQQGWLWKLHTQLARPGTRPHPCWQISPQSSHIHLSAPSSFCTFSASQINILTSSPSLPLHPSTQNLFFNLIRPLSASQVFQHQPMASVVKTPSQNKNLSLTFPG